MRGIAGRWEPLILFLSILTIYRKIQSIAPGTSESYKKEKIYTMLDFRRLFYFCTIVEQGQISRAAKCLHVSQPTLSQSLRELEDELGLTLIHRAGGAWQVTERGRAFYQEAQRILTQLNDLAQNIGSPHAGDAGIFGEARVGCSSFCLSFFLKALPRMEREYPGIRVRVMVADNITLETQIQHHGLDFALLQLPLMYSNCMSISLGEQHYAAVYSPLLQAPSDFVVSLEELARHPLLLSRRWSNGDTFRPFIIALQKKRLKARILLDTPTSHILLDMLPGLPAVAILPNTEIPSDRAAAFAVRRVDLPQLVFHPSIVHRQDSNLSGQADKLIELILTEAGLPRS